MSKKFLCVEVVDHLLYPLYCFLDSQLPDIHRSQICSCRSTRCSSNLGQSARWRHSCEVSLVVALVLLQQHSGNNDDRVGEARLQHLWATQHEDSEERETDKDT